MAAVRGMALIGVLLCHWGLWSVDATVINYTALGAKADDESDATTWANGEILNKTLPTLKSGDTFVVPEGVFHLVGGITVAGLRNVTFQIDGTLMFTNDRKTWPRRSDTGRVLDCLQFVDIENVRFTSTTRGTLDGNGEPWWGAIKYLEHAEDRPKILQITNSAHLVVENILFKNSPYWTTFFDDVDDVIIRYCQVDVRFANSSTHNDREIQAFNTDGFDLAGSNIHIHDVNIWNDDDCIAVKDLTHSHNRAVCSENWLVERVNASGFGLTIGSIGATVNNTCVRNITFRDATMHRTLKGIYMKSRPDAPAGHRASIKDILYQNITMYEPEQWPIWIGPAQQTENKGDCSLLWPNPAVSCPVPSYFDWDNITLRDVFILNAKMSPGVVIGNITNPMKNIVFDNVQATPPSLSPWGTKFYACYAAEGKTERGTIPVPPCFNGGPQCLEDGMCKDEMSTPCCSRRQHATAACLPYAKCGCIPAGTCADYSADCCSGKCHKTALCGVGITCRCD